MRLSALVIALISVLIGCSSAQTEPEEPTGPPPDAGVAHHSSYEDESEMCLEPPPEVVDPEPCDEEEVTPEQP